MATQQKAHDLATDAAKLRALHVPGDPLLLANIWDPPTANLAQVSGARAIATASAAVAPVNGYEDHGKLPPDVAFRALRLICDAVTLPVTADLEDGYGLPPHELVERTIDAGACGFNLEDTDHRAHALVEADRQAERIAASKAAGRERGIDVVLNARIDVHIHKQPLEEGLMRAERYLAAGADCIYPILLSDLAGIRAYVALGPTNVLYSQGGPSLAELAACGVARISVGPFLYKSMLKRLRAAMEALYASNDDGVWN